MNGIHEVGGSIPPGSTIQINSLEDFRIGVYLTWLTPTCGQEGSGLWGDSDRAALPIAVPLTVFRPACMSAFGGLSGHASSAS